MILLIYFLFFSEEYGRTTQFLNYQYNFTPFREISRFIKYRDILGAEAFMINIVGNIVVFMPFGFFIPGLAKRKHGPFLNFLKITGFGFLFSLTVETAQLVSKVGCFDVDDLILNTVGVALGCACYSICRCMLTWYRKKRTRKERERK